MRTFSRPSLMISAGALLAGTAGCAGLGGDGPAGQQVTDRESVALERFEPCAFFAAGELNSWGFSTAGAEFAPASDEPGCRHGGDGEHLSVQKNVEESVDSYQESQNWAKYERRDFAGRSGAVAVPYDAAGSCDVLVDAGGGLAIYQLTPDSNVDPAVTCAELADITERTAARLPE